MVWQVSDNLDIVREDSEEQKVAAIQAKVRDPFPTNEPAPLLSSERLKTLRFEISATPGAGPYALPGYYSYLASCIMSGGLPRLRRLFVRDESFPGKLSGLPPPQAAFAPKRPGSSSSSFAPAARVPGRPSSPRSPPFAHAPMPMSPVGRHKRFSSNNPFALRAAIGPLLPATQTLEVFTKDDEYGKWNFARVDSLTTVPHGANTTRRPMSSYGLAADVTGPGWDRGEARRSVLIGNGMSGFLAVPGDKGEDVSMPGPPLKSLLSDAAGPRRGSGSGEPPRGGPRGQWK